MGIWRTRYAALRRGLRSCVWRVLLVLARKSAVGVAAPKKFRGRDASYLAPPAHLWTGRALQLESSDGHAVRINLSGLWLELRPRRSWESAPALLIRSKASKAMCGARLKLRRGTAIEISRFPCKRLLRMPGSTTTRGRHVSRVIDTGRIAFCGTENISTRTCLTPLNTSPAPSPVNASRLPSRTTRASHGAGTVRYTFTVTDFHHLPFAGLPAHPSTASIPELTPRFWSDQKVRRCPRKAWSS